MREELKTGRENRPRGCRKLQKRRKLVSVVHRRNHAVTLAERGGIKPPLHRGGRKPPIH